jgi:sigma-E factor negative regulatory protein RseA
MKQTDQTSKSQPSEQELESLSALMDAQTDELELRRLLKSMDQDPQKAEQLKAHWQRFHLAQDILHDRASPLGSGIAAAVAEQLLDEPAPGRPGRLGRWQQGLTRVAIAASVAVVFVVAMQSNLDDVATAPVAVNDAGQNDSLANTAPTMLADSEAIAVDPVAAERLRSYLEGIAIDVSEPVVTEHIQDSPLYRLVNEIQD